MCDQVNMARDIMKPYELAFNNLMEANIQAFESLRSELVTMNRLLEAKLYKHADSEDEARECSVACVEVDALDPEPVSSGR